VKDTINEEAATQIAREMAAAGQPPEEIIRHLMGLGVDRGVAVSVVFIRTSAADRRPAATDRPNPIPGGPTGEGHTIAAFRRCWIRQIVASLVAVGAVLLVACGASDRKAVFLELTGESWMHLGLAILGGVVLFSFVNYRCPTCYAYLGRSIMPSYCQNCGARLS
jgi:hypothetical protein